ncbi:MAG TPA: MXAN_5808 family serine peptidase [Polyangiaceae bacterium]|nr:MXAN_5808 family serine peptidase [Polyangiaceae bacterium]
MHILRRFARLLILVGAFSIACLLGFCGKPHGGGLWQGLAPAIAAGNAAAIEHQPAPYDLTQLKVANEVLKTIRDRYVDPKRVKPREMLLTALDYVQKDVAQVIVTRDEATPSTVKVRVDTQEKQFRVDDVVAPWDVSSHLRDVFAFVQDGLRGTDVDLRDVEYAACNGMLHTLDPHSVLLSPEAYKEMNLSTQGQFGGLGIVISIRDQQLTVIDPMPNTPAGRAGLKRYDRITKINNESTLNMGLNEAVNHLRGAPGTKVNVWIHRETDGWQGSRPFELTREVIHVASVEHKLLDGGIGYVRLKQFQQNTTTELQAALADMKRTGELKGLVLDLRGNPGGLLEQAAKVVDTFVADGPIVATVGNPSEGREEKVAHGDGTEPNYPLAVLVNGSSASASEIVTGALKNHDRAVIVGETTFGKGSVQLVFTDLPDKAALKLTIAQYLTEPGDVSIQGVGVTPDIELDPMTVDPLEMDLNADPNGLKERDLSRALSNVRAKEGARPVEVVRYDLPIKDRLEQRERGGELDENFELDFPIQFAHGLLGHVQPGKRLDQVRQARPFIGDARRAEVDKVAEELKGLGVDWADAATDVPMASPPSPPAGIEVKVETDRPENEVTAGDSMNLKLTVTNHGTLALYRLVATTKSENPLFDNKELVIGRLDPGKSRMVTAPAGWCELKGHKVGSTAQNIPKDAPRVCSVPKDALMRADGVKFHFEEARGRAPADAELRTSVKSLDRPIFAYSYEIIDNRRGNGDGRVQKGEDLTMYLTVKNVGKGRSFSTMANLRNLSGEGLLLHDGRFDVSNMMPGDTKRMAFTFDVESGLEEREAKVELSIRDDDLRESVVEKVRIPIADPFTVAAAGGALRAKGGGAELFNEPGSAGRSFARLPPGTSATVLGTVNGYAKLSLGEGRFAFARSSELEQAPSVAGGPTLEDAMAHAPPALEIPQPQLATRETHTRVRGSAIDDARLLDAYIFVGSRKVFYRSNRNGPDPKKMAFDADVPLRAGVNVVTVVARENPDTTTHRTFIVRRDGVNGELLATPKTDDELSENASSDDD